MCVHLCFSVWRLQTKHTRNPLHEKRYLEFHNFFVFYNGGVKCFSLHFVLLDSRGPSIMGKAEINHLLIGTPVPIRAICQVHQSREPGVILIN